MRHIFSDNKLGFACCRFSRCLLYSWLCCRHQSGSVWLVVPLSSVCRCMETVEEGAFAMDSGIPQVGDEIRKGFVVSEQKQNGYVN